MDIDAAHAHIHERDQHDHHQRHQQHRQERQPRSEAGRLEGIADQGGEAGKEVGDDTGEDQQRDAVAKALLGNALADPHGQGGTAGHAHAHQHRVKPAALDVAKAGYQADGLHHGEAHGNIAGDLGDFLLALGAALLQALQSGDGDGQKLHDNGGVDVGGDTHGHDGHVLEVGTGHHVDQIQQRQRVGAHGGLHARIIDAGGGNDAHQTEHHQHQEGVDQLFADVLHLPRVAKRLPNAYFVRVPGHLTSPRLSRRGPRSSPWPRR